MQLACALIKSWFVSLHMHTVFNSIVFIFFNYILYFYFSGYVSRTLFSFFNIYILKLLYISPYALMVFQSQKNCNFKSRESEDLDLNCPLFLHVSEEPGESMLYVV